MKLLFRTCTPLIITFCCLCAAAQKNQVEIHQINVGNGDGALIKLFDNDALVYTILIDGGLPSTTNTFVPYLKEFLPDMTGHPGKKKIDWVILSHNHQDHFNGLVQVFNDDAFIIEKITDQGGYVIGADNYTLPLKEAKKTNSVPYITPAKGKKTPQPALIEYVKAVKTANTRSKLITLADITRVNVFDTTAKTFQDIALPTVGGTAVSMICIATNAYTRGISATTARDLGSKNPNNFSFGWILQFGQFRFYSGGDLGGYGGGYTDQETPMADYLKGTYTTSYPLDGTGTATNFPGHVCVMKTDHHGSTNSSNPTFLQALAYSAIVTSAGSHKRWKIPTVEFVNRVAANPAFGAMQGIYFTQLYNYTGDQALKQANTKFKGKAAYDYIEPTSASTGQYSYIFVAKKTTQYPDPPHGTKTVDITAESTFEVDKVKTSDFSIAIQHFFKCHKP